MIQDQGATPNIPPKSNRRWKPCFSKRLYRERNLIERFFSKLKHSAASPRDTTNSPPTSSPWSSSPQCASGSALMSLRPKNFLREMQEAGFLDVNGVMYPKMQMLTVAEILSGKRFLTPSVAKAKMVAQPSLPLGR